MNTALEVKVAPETTSTPSKGPFLPMNWLRKASSVQGVAMPAVSPEASTVRVAMVPSSLKVAVTVTSDSRPLAEAVFAPSGRGSAAVSTTGSSAVSEPKGAASGLAGASTAALTALTTAVEVTVAPAMASMFSPMAKGAVFPMNCSAKAGSSMQRVPKPAVSPEDSMARPVMAPEASLVSWTRTSEAKPRALPSWMSPSRAICSTTTLAGAPRLSTGAVYSMFSRAAAVSRALLDASMTALEVTVAPEMASMEPPSAMAMSLKVSSRSVLFFHLSPMPAVSLKLLSPTFAPVITPFMSTPRVTATVLWKPLTAPTTQ